MLNCELSATQAWEVGSPSTTEHNASNPTRRGFLGTLGKDMQLVKAVVVGSLGFSAQLTELSLPPSCPAGPYQGEGTRPSGWLATGHLDVMPTGESPLSAGARLCGSLARVPVGMTSQDWSYHQFSCKLSLYMASTKEQSWGWLIFFTVRARPLSLHPPLKSLKNPGPMSDGAALADEMRQCCAKVSAMKPQATRAGNPPK